MTTHVAQQWVPDVSDFATRLVLIRHHMGWNAKEAALACGISPQSWREWELSGRRPRDYEGVCKQIAARTKCDLIWLMTGDPNLLGGAAAASVQPVACISDTSQAA
jgi:transcriptional regulator with XRE-family HTH domain